MKTNIIEKIKNDSPGTVYWCVLCGECYVTDTFTINGQQWIMVQPLNSITHISLTPDGREYPWYDNGECLLWPSKDVRTWDGYGEKGLSMSDVFGFDPMASVDAMISCVKVGA